MMRIYRVVFLTNISVCLYPQQVVVPPISSSAEMAIVFRPICIATAARSAETALMNTNVPLVHQSWIRRIHTDHRHNIIVHLDTGLVVAAAIVILTRSTATVAWIARTHLMKTTVVSIILLYTLYFLFLYLTLKLIVKHSRRTKVHP